MNLLTFVIASVSIAAHPLAWSDVKVTLTSGGNQLELPRKLACSCQLGVFSVSNDTYLLTVQSKQAYSHARVKLLPSEACLVAGLDNTFSAVFNIKNTQYNGYEITTSFLVDFFTP